MRYELYTKRVISGMPCTPMVGVYDSIEQCERALYSLYFLDAYAIDSLGQRYSLSEIEYIDSDGDECVRLNLVKD